MVDINTKSTIDTKESVDVPLVPGDESKFPAHQTVLASSNSNLTNSLKGNVRSDGKRKLPEKREKCDICGRMLLNAGTWR